MHFFPREFFETILAPWFSVCLEIWVGFSRTLKMCPPSIDCSRTGQNHLCRRSGRVESVARKKGNKYAQKGDLSLSPAKSDTPRVLPYIPRQQFEHFSLKVPGHHVRGPRLSPDRKQRWDASSNKSLVVSAGGMKSASSVSQILRAHYAPSFVCSV